jgi:uncharacterized membrane protein YkvA (DUF1232 family)
MKIRTVSDLRYFLEANKFSPEIFAGGLKISGMTIRRLLVKSPTTLIPEKYHAALDQVSGAPIELSLGNEALLGVEEIFGEKTSRSFKDLIGELEESGKQCQDLKKLEEDSWTKLEDKNVGREFVALVKSLVQSLSSKNVSFQSKAIAAGALLYFINPLDLIPDTIPVVGYLDDFAVLSLAAALLLKARKKDGTKSPSAKTGETP